MPKVTFFTHAGACHEVQAKVGDSLMRAAVDHSIPGIDADCGGQCACATCHVYVPENWFDKLEKAPDAEQDMIDMAYEPKKNSRLSCQIIVSEKLDGLEVTMPIKQT